ncbi:MAG: formate dehydrogenase accessory sulfurtransferase FdhD [Rubritalea sp.]|uniref:formate dehydrogenase accessory sulfurtransferase FdhD n=1 Tax=Rubritalea sp. TaxID=2109375 RepID=UPI00324253F4
MSSESRSRRYPITQYQNGSDVPSEDSVAVEEPLQITLDGHPIAVVMRTPCDDLDLVRGFLLTEAILPDLDGVMRIDVDQNKNHALVFLKDDVTVDFQRHQRNLYSASSCGICGKATIDSIRQDHPKLGGASTVCSKVLLSLPDRLRDAQRVFNKTGGLHAAGLFSNDGTLLVLREDVGRHNAIDKVLGYAAQQTICLSEVILQVSGRVSFEVMQKAHALGVPIVSAISAPTSLAVEFAQESGQTLIGFLRPPRFNCYAGSERVS